MDDKVAKPIEDGSAKDTGLSLEGGSIYCLSVLTIIK